MPPPIRYRDLQAPTLIDANARSTPTGAAQATNELAQAFSSFSRAASDVGSELSANLGAEQGTKEGLTGTPKLRKGIRAMTAHGRAYNSAAEAGYSARVQVDIDETLRRLEDEHEADPEGFDTKVSEYGKGLVEASPPELRDRVALVLKSRAAASGQRVRNQATAKERAQIQADYLTSMPARVSNTIAMMQTLDPDTADAALTESVSDNEAQLAALVNDNVISPLEAAKYAAEYRQSIDEGLTEMRISGRVEDMVNAMKTSVAAGDRMFNALDGDKSLSEADKEQIRKDYKAAREDLSFGRSREHVVESGELARSIAAEGFGNELEAENARLYDRGALSVDEYESNIAAMTRNAKAAQEKGIDIEAVQAAMNGGPGLDPTNKDQRDAVDYYLKAVTAASGMVPGDDRYQAFVSEMVRKTNILPESADSWARVNLLSGNPDQVALGAGFLGRIKEANPRAWNYADDPRVGALVDQVNQFMRAGVVTEKAFMMAHKNVYERTDAERQLLNDRYREAIRKDDNSTALQDILDGDENFDRSMFRGVPPAPLSMQAEFDSLTQEFYRLNNGDLEASRRMAGDAVREMYGYTTINGEPELMKYAPEKMFPGMTPEIVRQDLEGALSAISYPGDAKSVRLVPSAETERTGGRVFQLATVDEYGTPDVVLAPDNRPALYALPLGTQFDAARKAVTQRKTDEAQAEFDAAQQRMKETGDLERHMFEFYNKPEYLD